MLFEYELYNKVVVYGVMLSICNKIPSDKLNSAEATRTIRVLCLFLFLFARVVNHGPSFYPLLQDDWDDYIKKNFGWMQIFSGEISEVLLSFIHSSSPIWAGLFLFFSFYSSPGTSFKLYAWQKIDR